MCFAASFGTSDRIIMAVGEVSRGSWSLRGHMTESIKELTHNGYFHQLSHYFFYQHQLALPWSYYILYIYKQNSTHQVMTALPTKLALVFAALAPLGETAPWNPKNTHWHQQRTTGKALYFITNEAENAVVALPIKSNGSLAAGRSIKTGGAGAVMIQASSGNPQLPDGLASQSSLTIVGNVCGSTLRR